MPAFLHPPKPHSDPIYKYVAECYLRVWFNSGSEITRVAAEMKVSKGVVRKLVTNLQNIYAQLPGARFPSLHMLNKFGKAMGYETHFYIEKS